MQLLLLAMLSKDYLSQTIILNSLIKPLSNMLRVKNKNCKQKKLYPKL